MTYKAFSSIVIAGGATKVISAIGIMQFLEEHNMVKSIKNLVGTSAGAIMCTFLALGYSSQEVKDFFVKNLCVDESVYKMNLEDVFSFFSSFGLTAGNNIITFFRRMIVNKLGPDRENITFMELAKLCGKNLVICVSNLTMERREFWSVDTKPDISIIDALRASCAIPLVFTPVIIGDNYYLDGGLYDNFPIDYFNGQKLKDVLGINIKSTGYQRTNNFIEYIKFIIFSVMDKLADKMIEDNTVDNIISLDFEDDDWLSLLDLSIKIPEERVDDYVRAGYEKIKAKLTDLYIKFS